MEYLILSFLLGSIPTGYILILLSGKGDIRKFGSKNIITFSLIIYTLNSQTRQCYDRE